MKRALILVALIGSFAPPAWAECFTVVQKNLIVYRSEITPIDLTGPIHVALQKRFPGGQLVISGDVRNCTSIDPASPVDPLTGAAASAPGSERAGLSFVPGPLANAPANVAGVGGPSSAQDSALDEGCRRGGTVTRRGAPCPETVVGGTAGTRVVGSEEAVRAPVVEERPRVRQPR